MENSMRHKPTIATLALAFSFLIWGSIHAAEEDGPVITKATFRSHTLDEDKDHDTGVYVKVFTSDGSTQIAHADNRDNSGDDGTQYKDYSDHEFGLDIDADGLRKAAAQGFAVQVCQHTNGHDTWRFQPTVVLKFSDGTNLTRTGGNMELKNDGACTSF